MSSGREERVAKRYARALFEVTTPVDFDKVEGQLSVLAQAWKASPEFRDSLSNPRVSEEARGSVVGAIVDAFGGWTTEPVKRAVVTLSSLRRGSVFPALAEAFSLLVSEYKRSLLLEVTFPQPVADTVVTDLQKKLSSSLGGEVKITVKIDPSLIGGVTIRLGDTLLDRSVSGTLQRLAGQLAR
jgi:F-type H+-transporting ATPase subunit delta